LGRYSLRDLAAPEHVHQLVAPGAPADFPPLRSLAALPNNLPRQLTSFVGRDAEIRALSAQLHATRWLTPTGPGGAGTTRWSIEVARGLLDAFPDGIYFYALEQLAADRLPSVHLAR
jgi:hypothetical protein